MLFDNAVVKNLRTPRGLAAVLTCGCVVVGAALWVPCKGRACEAVTADAATTSLLDGPTFSTNGGTVIVSTSGASVTAIPNGA